MNLWFLRLGIGYTSGLCSALYNPEWCNLNIKWWQGKVTPIYTFLFLIALKATTTTSKARINAFVTTFVKKAIYK